jgi:hypothetical protein
MSLAGNKGIESSRKRVWLLRQAEDYMFALLQTNSGTITGSASWNSTAEICNKMIGLRIRQCSLYGSPNDLRTDIKENLWSKYKETSQTFHLFQNYEENETQFLKSLNAGEKNFLL